jgi:ankyrin repeat protein
MLTLALAQSTPSPPLIDAVSEGDLAKVQDLLAKGADPNMRERTYPVLVLAIWSAKPSTPSILAALLKAGADASAVGSDTKAAAQLTAESPKPAYLAVFLDNRVSPDWRNANRESLLGIAASLGNAETVKLLLERKANVDAQDDEGFTPLMNACQNRHIEVVRLLLGKGANKELKSKYGDTARTIVSGKYDDTQAGRARKAIAELILASSAR